MLEKLLKGIFIGFIVYLGVFIIVICYELFQGVAGLLTQFGYSREPFFSGFWIIVFIVLSLLSLGVLEILALKK